MFILSLAGMGVTYGAIANNHKNNTLAVANKIIGPLIDVDTSVNTVTDHAPNDTSVGIVVKAADPDKIDTVTYSLINNAGGRFKINPGTGIITVANGAALDHITAQSHIIRVRATSSDGSYSEQDFTINVTAAQTVAVDDAVTAIGGQSFTSAVSLLANDSDVDGPSKLAVAGTFVTAQGGSLVLAADGSYTYTAAVGFSGTDTVSYTVTDGALTDIGLLTITVTAVNDAPVAVDDAVTVIEDTPYISKVFQHLLANDTDVDGPSLSVVAGTFTTTQGGSLLMTVDGVYTYTPPAGFSGTDTFSYTITDGSLTDSGLLTLTVTAVNDAPVAVDDAVTAIGGQSFTSAVSLLANDSDVDGPSKLAVPGTFVTAQGGSLVLAANGSYTYTPATGFSGTDTVSYSVTDGALTDSGLLTITVSPSLVLIPIVAVDDTVTANAGTPFSSSVSLLANDIEGSPDKVAVAGTYSTAQGGTLVLASNGHYTYTPPTGFSGTDTVSYTVTDSLLSDSGLLTITVNPLPTEIVTIDAIGIDSGTYRDFITSDNDGLWVSFTLNESLKLDETVWGPMRHIPAPMLIPRLTVL